MATTTFSTSSTREIWHGSGTSYNRIQVAWYSGNSNGPCTICQLGFNDPGIDWSDKLITQIKINFTPATGCVGSTFYIHKCRSYGATNSWNGSWMLGSDVSNYTTVSMGSYTVGTATSVTLSYSSQGDKAALRWLSNWIKNGNYYFCMTLDGTGNGATNNNNKIVLSSFSMTVTYETFRSDRTIEYTTSNGVTITDYESYYATGSGPNSATGGSCYLCEKTQSAHRVGYYNSSESTNSRHHKRLLIHIPQILTSGTAGWRISSELWLKLTTNNKRSISFSKVNDTSDLSCDYTVAFTPTATPSDGWYKIDLMPWAINTSGGRNFAIWPGASYTELSWVVADAKVVVKFDLQQYTLTYNANSGSGAPGS